MSKHIDLLNSRLAEGLGRIGGQGRFAWCFAPEVFYFYRPPTALNFERYCWADQLGKVWLLCQWTEPKWIDHTGATRKITTEDWYASFKGEFPYPDRGAYNAHPETALKMGIHPTAENTAFYIDSIREQMEKDFAAHLAESNARQAQIKLEHEKEFYASAENDFPAFWKNGQGHEPGTRGGHVSIGGI